LVQTTAAPQMDPLSDQQLGMEWVHEIVPLQGQPWVCQKDGQMDLLLENRLASKKAQKKDQQLVLQTDRRLVPKRARLKDW
jgi:hypothetical protein